MIRWCLLLAVALITGTHACCYTLQSNPLRNKVPVYTWHLDTLSQHAVRPTDCVGELRAVDQRNGAALTGCEMQSVQYRPMQTPQIDWKPLNLSVVNRVLFAQPCVGFGPYRAGDPASSVLLHQLSDSWIRLQLKCPDSAFSSCVNFGLRLRQAAESTLDVDEQDDPFADSCVRTPSATPSSTGTPSHTPTPTGTPSPTALPEFPAVYRVEATFEDDIFIALQFGVNFERLRATSGREGAHWCATPVLGNERTHLVTTLYAELTEDERRRGHHSHTLVNWAAQATAAQQSITAVVLWQSGGFCRVSVAPDNTMEFLGCRLLVDDRVYESVQWSQTYTLDPRAVQVCGTVVSAGEPEPSAEPRPVACSADIAVRHDPEHSLVVLRDSLHYAEVELSWVGCTDGSERPRIDRTSALLRLDTHEEIAVAIDYTTRARAVYADEHGQQLLLMAVPGTNCASIESERLEITERCVSISGAILLVE